MLCILCDILRKRNHLEKVFEYDATVKCGVYLGLNIEVSEIMNKECIEHGYGCISIELFRATVNRKCIVMMICNLLEQEEEVDWIIAHNVIYIS